MKLSLNTNIGSLTAQNQLLKASEKLQTSFERLSSGLRINRASDDPAGLAMASGLQTDSRLMAQAVRNVNDGISLLTIAESALKELNNILGRQAELAQQAANGTYTFEQRIALHQEVNSLVEEYNRIINTTEFNGRKLLNRDTQDMSIQAGIDSSGVINFNLADDLAHLVGDGTLQDRITYADGSRSYSIYAADLNNDGMNDIISAAALDDVISVYINNGDGTFATRVSYDAGAFPTGIVAMDLNGDGIADIASTSGNDSRLNIFIGQGNGTFTARVSYEAGVGINGTRALTAGDFNGDGKTDLATVSGINSSLNVFLNNGDGTFIEQTSIFAGDYSSSLTNGDVNNDGILDIVNTSGNDTQITVHLGLGNGTFTTHISFDGIFSPGSIQLADFNNDGMLDLTWSNSNPNSTFHVALGNGNGTFEAPTSYEVGSDCNNVVITDINGDGIHDIVSAAMADSWLGVFIGEGDGTFNFSETFAAGTTARLFSADLNGDGVEDFLTADRDQNSISVFVSNTTETTTMPYLHLTTQSEATESLEIVKDTISRVSAELGNIGAAQSRLSHTVNHLQVMRENYAAANSKIVDADIAEEVSQMVRQQILQQAITAVMAQANQQPALVLELLK